MKLLSIELKSYRVHRNLRVDLDPSRTVITGPNESGKSTLIEAAHRALFMKAKITGDAQRRLRSDRHPGHPEVKLTFEAGNATYTVTKRFSGLTGTTTLTEAGGSTLHGDEAEERLNGILGVGASESGRGAEERVNRQWAHLWAWQGRAASDPADHANDQIDSLLSRLQTSGGAVVMQSDLDGQVATAVGQERDVEFTENGKARKNSELDLATDAARQAADRLASARLQMQQLLDAVQKFEDAQRTIQIETASLAQLNPQRESVESKLTQVSALRGTEQTQQRDAADQGRQLRDLSEAGRKIEEARAEVKRRVFELAPMEAKAEELRALEADLRVDQSKKEQAQQDASAKLRTVRRRTAALDAYLAYFERVAQRDKLKSRFKRVTKSRKERDELQAVLAKLPAMSPQKLKAVEKLQRSVDDAETTLNAMGAGIQVIASDVDVCADDVKLKKGKAHLVTEDTEIRIGKGVRLRITPGGGVSLATAREHLGEARQALQNALDDAGIGSTNDAVEIANQRKQLDAQIKSVDAQLDEADADSVDDEVSTAEEAVIAAQADIDRRCAAVEGLIVPKDASVAKAMRKTIEPECEEAEANEQSCSSARDAAAKRLAKKSDELSSQLQAVNEERRALDLLRGQEHTLVKIHGSDEERRVELARLGEANSSAQAKLEETRRKLTELQPDLLEADLKRLDRSVKQAQDSKTAASAAFLVAQDQLFRDGTSDPRSDLLLAETAERSASARLVPARRRAESVRLLDELFTEAQRALAEQFTKPLADKISVYLQCIFGARCRVDLSIDKSTFGNFSLVRDDAGGGACSFDALSGGTKEQVAAAVRLGIAEVLAEGHEGCLPVVLDEAFAYSDPERIQALQRMLDLATHRGLQIIVLTNNVTDFAGLGAKQVVLRVDATARREQASDAGALIDEKSTVRADVVADVASDPSVSDADCQEFVDALMSEGGASGNISLRKRLGWDEQRYRTVKEHLVEGGAVSVGAGRGGTVSLVRAAGGYE